MSTTTNVTSTYAGEFAQKYIAAALLSGSTINKGGVEVKANIKYKQVVKKLATGDLIADYACDFNASSSITLTERVLEPKQLVVNLQLCKNDYRADWEAAQMGYSAHDNLPPTFEAFLMSHIAAKVAEETEFSIWQGAKSNAGEFDGFVTLATADATVIDESATTVTASNVLAELRKVLAKIPNRLWGKSDLKIYVSTNIARAYVQALGGFVATIGGAGVDNKGTGWYNNGVLSIDGVELFVADGMADNQMVAGQVSNLWFGTGLLNDNNEVKIIDMSEIDGSDNIRVVMKFTAAVQYGIGSEIVLYS